MTSKGESAAKAANGNALSSSKRSYSFDDERRTITALRPMRHAALARGEEPDGPGMIFEVIRFMVDIDRRQSGDRPSQPGNAWFAHVLHNAQEQREAFAQRKIEL